MTALTTLRSYVKERPRDNLVAATQVRRDNEMLPRFDWESKVLPHVQDIPTGLKSDFTQVNITAEVDGYADAQSKYPDSRQTR